MKLRKALAFVMILTIILQMGVYEKPVDVQAAVSSERISIFSDIYTDKAAYNPGDSVEIVINLNNNTQNKISKLEIQPMHLNKKADSAILVDCNMKPFTKKTKKVTWTAGSEDFQGYLLEIYAKDENGKVIDQGSVAVDVSSDWRKFPRYGYVYDFGENVNAYGKIEQMSKYHINVIEYYDWQYLHHQPLAPEEMLNHGVYQDWAGRSIYVDTIKDYLRSAKSKNMVNMAYDMIYAGTDEFIAGENNEHRNWQVYFKDDNSSGSGAFYFTMGDSPSGNGHLYFMNPLNTDWQNYIFGQVNKIFDYFDFDGWHGDTVGDWGNMTTPDGKPLGYTNDGQPIYSITDTYKQFLDAAKSALGDKYLSFNPVGAKGIIQANTSAVDALYTEFWPWDSDRDGDSYNTYYSLAKEVENSMNDSNGKSLAVKSYINYNAGDGYMNTPAVMLVNSAVFAAGGNRVELGNGNNILHHEYYPNDGVKMNNELKSRMRNMYDFAVAYENILRDGQSTTENKVVTKNYNSSKNGEANTIWTYTREGNGYQMLHMINLLDTDNQWRDEDRTKSTPTKAENIEVKYYYSGEVNSLYLASPDINGGMTQSIDFQKGEDSDGKYIEFTVNSLEYWNLLYMSSDSPSELNEKNSFDYTLTFEGEDYYTEKLAEGQADLQPGEAFSFYVPEKIQKGNYEVSVISCGNRTKFQVSVNDGDALYIEREGNGFGMNQMTEDKLSQYVYLEGGEQITIADNIDNGSGYGWVDKVLIKLAEPDLDEYTNTYEYPEGILYKMEAEDGTFEDKGGSEKPQIVSYDTASESKIVNNIGLNQGKVCLTVPEEVEEGNYDLVLNYSSGTDGLVNIWINNRCYKMNYSKTDGNWSFVSNENGIGDIHIKPGDTIKIQDAVDNCWIWLDYIYLTNTGRYEKTDYEETWDADIRIDGFQISTTKEGYRTAYTVDDPSDEVESVGMIYGIADYVGADALLVGNDSEYVKYYEATENGILENIGTSTRYVMTMEFVKTAEFYNANLYVRAYAKLKDGTYIYSDVENLKVYDIAEYIYRTNMMTNQAAHDYLYDNIIYIVNPLYEKIEFKLENSLVRP